MQALRYESEVTPRGTLRLPRLPLKKGTLVEVIVLAPEERGAFGGLLKASESSLDFWNNPIDDEIWNDA